MGDRVETTNDAMAANAATDAEKGKVKAGGEELPLVTFALFAYNQEKYIREAVEGALAQDYPNLEIIISDDCSTDGTWAAIEELVGGYTGPHRVVLNRNERNLGIGSHVNLIGGLAGGGLVVLAAGDDISHPGRVRKLHGIWSEFGCPPACIYSDVIPVDSHGNPVKEWEESVFPGPHSLRSFADGDIRILGASTAYTRDVFQSFPPMSPCVSHEDRVLPHRALLLGGRVVFTPDKLVKYRTTGGVSRSYPTSRKQYLQAVSGIESRSLRDAAQRLMDALAVKHSGQDVITHCVRRLTNHQAFINISSGTFLTYEIELFKSLRQGASLWPTIKLCLKFRLFGR